MHIIYKLNVVQKGDDWKKSVLLLENITTALVTNKMNEVIGTITVRDVMYSNV